eukprot:scaffold72216_cov20-Tisochrysis_lutea.AAC.1
MHGAFTDTTLPHVYPSAHSCTHTRQHTRNRSLCFETPQSMKESYPSAEAMVQLAGPASPTTELLPL